MDQFHAQHLCPILHCIVVDPRVVIPWEVQEPPPPPQVTMDSSRRILRKAPKSTPYRDLVEYCMPEWLHDAQLKWVVDFVCNVANGLPVAVLVHRDFYALPNKVPHGPLANAPPLLNCTTMWKLTGAHIANHRIPLRTQSGVMPSTKFALHASSCIADLLRVLHNYIW